MKELSKKTLQSLYIVAQENEKKELESIYGVEFFQVNKLDTWEKIVAFVNDPMKTTLPYLNPVNKIQRKLNAAFKLDLIAEIKNGDWIADFDNSTQQKWSPYFYKENCGWVAAGVARYFYDRASAGVGSYFKTEELALEVQIDFMNIYLDLLP